MPSETERSFLMMMRKPFCITNNADNEIESDGAKALGQALLRKQNPDNSWADTHKLQSLSLYGTAHSCCYSKRRSGSSPTTTLLQHH